MDNIEHYIDEFGNERWQLDGEYHRDDGPAYISSNGGMQWCRHGLTHREDGPAILWPGNAAGWYIAGTKHTFDEYCKKLSLSQEQILELKIKYL